MKRRSVAVIDERRCIGCTLCIPACPVDAIVGARRLMHTVVEPWCIGCRLCLAPCPVECIEMVAAPERPWTARDAAGAKRRAAARQKRLSVPGPDTTPARRRAVIAAILRRRAK